MFSLVVAFDLVEKATTFFLFFVNEVLRDDGACTHPAGIWLLTDSLTFVMIQAYA